MDHNLHLFLGKAVDMNLLFILPSLVMLWCLCDHGVSGVMDGGSVSVNEGDSVTLYTDVKTNQQENIRWYFNASLIAEITGDLSFVCTDVKCKNSDERFRNRLKLDHQTGSLTIINTRTTDTGVYKLKFTKNRRDKIFIVFVHGFFSVDTSEESAFMMEGDSVTLHTDVETSQQEKIRWYFNNIRIAQITGDQTNICTDVQCNEGTERFRDRLKLDHQTGSLTIINTSEPDSGVYRLRIIISSNINEKIFIVAVYGVPAVERDKMKKKSVKEGESVSFDPGVIKKQNDLMAWYFNNTLIAKITGNWSKICTRDQCEDADGRLKLDHQTGSLTITNTRTTDSGDYKLQINNSRISIIKIFSVTVTAVSDSTAAAVAVVVAVLLVAVAAVIYYCQRKSKQARQNDIMQHNHDQGNGVDSIPLSERDSIDHC